MNDDEPEALTGILRGTLIGALMWLALLALAYALLSEPEAPSGGGKVEAPYDGLC